MNKSIPLIMLVLICLAFSVISWTPQGDIDLRNHYNIINGTDINSTEFYQDGNKVVDESSILNLSTNYSSHSNSSLYWDDLNTSLEITSLGNSSFEYFSGTELNATTIYQNGSTLLDTSTEPDLNVNHSNSTTYWLGYNLVSQLNYRILSYWQNITGRATHLSNFTDDLGDRGYTVLSNFTDDLGDRGYDSLSNFTNNIDLINSTYGNATYILQSEEGNLNTNSSNSTSYWDNIDSPDNFTNTTVSEYMFGQPLVGSIGSGIIYTSKHLDVCGCTNVTDSGGLELHYPNITTRTVCLDGTETYCNIPEGDINVTDNQHTVYYINCSCDIASDTFSNYYGGDILPADRSRIFDVYALNGEIEEVKGATVMQLSDMKSRQINVLCSSNSHLSVCDGFDITQDTAFAINVSGGHLVYLNTYLPTYAKSSLIDGLHLTHHTAGSWVHTNITSLNLTHCDNGTDLVECTGSAYRQYPIYSLNWNTNTIIHQLAPLLSDATFANLAACVEADPYYTMPVSEEYVAVVHHVYCAKRTDTSWDSDGWIDLRAAPVGGGGTPDLSIYLTKDGSRSLTAPWNAGQNITAPWFLGLFNWEITSDSTSWLNFNGSHLSFNETHSNATYAPINYGNDWNKTYADTLYSPINYGDDWNKTYADTLYAILGYGDNWNKTYADTLYADISLTDTNASTACTGGEVLYGNGSCGTPGSAGDITGVYGGDKYIINGSASGDVYLLINETELNSTIDARDSDTTYSAGNGISLSTTTFSVAGNTALTQDADGLSVTADGIGDTQLAYNTGQALTTASGVTFDNATISTQMTVETIKFETDPTNHYIDDNATCIVIRGDTSELRVC